MLPTLLIAGLLVLAVIGMTWYVGYRLSEAEQTLIPVSVLAMVAGVLFESKRRIKGWLPVILLTLGSYLLSFVAFLPGRRERLNTYLFENHIAIWPYAFVFIHLLLLIVLYKDKVIPRLTEGTTLIQSAAMMYWAIDSGFNFTSNLFLLFAVATGLLFSIYALFHAFTNAELSRASRLTLSVWSSVIMLLMAADYIYQLYQADPIEQTEGISQALFTGLSYFLLGISGLYIFQSLMMLTVFLPDRKSFFNAAYYQEIGELKKTHIKRYSDKQVPALRSLGYLLFCGAVFFLNSYFQLLPRHTVIWAMVFVSPLLTEFSRPPKARFPLRYSGRR